MIEVRMAKTAKMIMNTVLAVKPGEKLCIVTDTERPPAITKVLAVAAEMAGAQTVVATMEPTGMSGVEPPAVVAAAMAAADVIINQTSHSMTHTNAQRAAVGKGARVCNIRNVNEDMMIRGGVTADYQEVKRITEILAAIIDQGNEVHIATPEGTDLRFSIKGRRGYVLAGYATNPGEFSGLPDGEAACAPLEGTAEGVIVNPYLMEDLDVVHDPIRIEFAKGLVTKVEGGREAKELERILEEAGLPGRNVAEFAFGTNPACRITGMSREDKKKLGTAHIAIGDSLSLGGTVESPMHMDIMFLRPTIRIDGKTIVENGELVIKV
ncbi:MAG TPA: aminopeptidase [Selenomonadales bacterium]|nr:aminopeptidase [Selenomonadales bacterium]